MPRRAASAEVGAGAVGPQGPPGNDGADGRTWHSGTGAPSSALGANGDFYLDTAASAYYGPKAAGVWPPGVTLIGPAGPSGANGSPGWAIVAAPFVVPAVTSLVSITFSASGWVPGLGAKIGGEAGIYTVTDASASPTLTCLLDGLSSVPAYLPGDTVPVGVTFGASGEQGPEGPAGAAGAGWFMFGANSSGTSNGVRYLWPEYSETAVSTSAVEWVLPPGVAFTVSSAAVHANGAGGGAGTITYSLRKNGTAVLSVVVAATATDATSTGTVTFAAGDKVACVCQASGAVTAGHTRPIVTFRCT